MSLPTIVYKSPGPHAGEYGRTYQSKGVDTQEALDAAHADGWRDSVAEACADAAGLPKKPSAAPAAPEPTDRDLLETKARLMGIEFDGRTSDKKLSERIAAAMSKE